MIDLRVFLASMSGSVVADAGAAKQNDKAPARKRTFGEAFERVILLIHRWIGIVACLFFIMWFISGVVLAYVRWPAMDRAARLDVLTTMDWQKVSAGPADAIGALGLVEFPKDLRLEMSGGEPVYRTIDWNKLEQVASAETGSERKPVSAQQALAIVSEQLGAPAATVDQGDLKSDQWTVTGYFDKHRPFHRIMLNDDAGSKYYVSVATGEIVLDTYKNERFWNWIGAIPHWLYFSIIRHDTAKWSWIVYVLSAAGIFVAISGIWIGIKRVRILQRYANGKRVPFSGWMRWHHVLGLVGGLFLSLWIISGLLTMYPGGFLEGRQLEKTDIGRFRGTQAATFPVVDFAALSDVAKDARRITFSYMAGTPILALEYRGSPTRVLDAITLRPITFESPLYRQAATALEPGAKLLSLKWIQDGDEYWHSAFAHKKLPIARAIFDDGVWFHIDPEAGAVVDVMDQTGRVDRWTAIGIHDLDWHWLLQRRPWWDFLLFFTIIPGLAISLTGLIIGFKRLRRTVEPTASFAPVPLDLDGLADGDHQAAPEKIATQRACIVYSSQTGTAEELAGQLQSALAHAGMEAEKHDLVDLSPAQLAAERLVLFVIATTGEGDPPDKATAFMRRHMRQPAKLQGMAYAVIALGDTEYPKYCQFGRQMDAWLLQSGAKRLFRTALVDKGEGKAIDAWVRNLEGSLDRSVHLERTQTFTEWSLVDRKCMNEGSVGAPIFRVDLSPVAAGETWLPGDIARIEAGIDWASHLLGEQGGARDYSIASLEDEGHISLFVRLTHQEDGTPGIGSGWLVNAPIGTSMALRVRSNPGFHPAPGDSPAIFIGNGTGYAGLRAHLRLRVGQAQRRSWLVYGERNRAHDCICRDEVDAFTEAGMLESCDLAFSRDQPERRYVQDVVRERREEIRRWVQDGAYIFVCGSQQGMAPGVHAALQEALGEDGLQQLAESGRYRRDVY